MLMSGWRAPAAAAASRHATRIAESAAPATPPARRRVRHTCHAACVTESAAPATPPKDVARYRHAAWPQGSERGPELGVCGARSAGVAVAPGEGVRQGR